MAHLELNPDRVLPSDPTVRPLAREIYASVKDLPIISPHGHVPAQWLADDEELACGCGVALHTPGHTPGSTSFWFAEAKLLIAGDTLFRRGIGRTDLWGGDYATIERSIRRLYTLDEDATVVTGHGPDTRLGDEMRENPFIRA